MSYDAYLFLKIMTILEIDTIYRFEFKNVSSPLKIKVLRTSFFI